MAETEQTFRSVREKHLLGYLVRPTYRYKIWMAVLLFFIILGLIGYYRQLKYGLVVTAMRDFTSWGIYISNFVFFVAVSLVGSLISSILKLNKKSPLLD